MAPAAREWRHLLLVTSIIAALPLLIYPNPIGLSFKLGIFWYVIIEFVYFYTMFRFLNPNCSNNAGVVYVILGFAGRLSFSAVFLLLLLVLGQVKPAVALQDAFLNYKPALILFTLTTPPIYNSTIKLLLPNLMLSRRNRRVRRSRARIVTDNPVSTARRMSTVQSTTEYFDYSFDGAVRHVGEYSGVVCVLLIDQDGLPLAQFDRGREDSESWAGLAIKIIADLETTLLKIGAGQTNWLEFNTAGKRFCLLRVSQMWLLSIATAAADELEKIRMQQAAEMIAKHYREKYDNLPISMMEKSYAGSTVGA